MKLGVVGIRRVVAIIGLTIVVATIAPRTGRAAPETWHAAALGGGEINFAPGLDKQLGGHGWVGFDSVGQGIVGGGDLRLFYYTTKVHVGIERIPFAGDKLAFFAFLEAEAFISQPLNDYFEQGRRIGGASPYVIPVPGLPRPGLISERLFAGQLGVHLKAKERSQHEFGILVAGGAFNDITRVGALNAYGGAGGLALFGDLRFGPAGRYQLDIRGSWAFPASWLLDPP